MRRDPFCSISTVWRQPTPQSLLQDFSASEIARYRGVKMQNLLLLEGQLDHFIVVSRYPYRRRSAHNRDLLCAGRKRQRVRQRHQMTSDFFIGQGACKLRVRAHRILELIGVEIRLSKIDGKID